MAIVDRSDSTKEKSGITSTKLWPAEVDLLRDVERFGEFHRQSRSAITQ